MQADRTLGCGNRNRRSHRCISETGRLIPVDVRVNRVNQILGTKLSAEDINAIFRKLEMKTETAGEGVIRVIPPSVRMDLEKEIDFVEEVAGYMDMTGFLPHCPKATANQKTKLQMLRI